MREQDIEATIPVKKSQVARYNLDPGSFFENRSWSRRPDGVVINEDLQIVYILQIFDQINFVVGNRGSVVESDFYTKLKKLDIQEGQKDKLFANHVTQVCEAHNRVIVSFLQRVQGGARPTTEGSRENIGHSVHV